MMPTIGIMTIVSAALTIYLCHDEYKNGKMSSKNNSTFSAWQCTPFQLPISQFQKLEVDYQLIIKNIIPKIANPSQIATILKFFELIFPFLYSSWHME